MGMDAPRREELGSVTDQEPLQIDAISARAAPGATLRLLGDSDPPLVFWSTSDGFSLAGAGAVRELHPVANESIGTLQAEAHRLLDGIGFDGPPEARPRLLGGMGFDRASSPSAEWRPLHPFWFILPQVTVTEYPDEQWTTVTAPEELDRSIITELADDSEKPGSPALPNIVDQAPEPRRAEWVEQVRTLRSQIDAGAFEKVVLAHTRGVTLDEPPNAAALVRSLQATNPNCHVFCFQPDADTIFAGATPERLVSRREGHIQTDALAGSTGRGESVQADERLCTALEESVKNGHEHDLVVDAITERLHTLGATVTTGERRVRQLRAVQHLHTPISADHPNAPHVLQVVDALHPTPAVGGLPREAALCAIRETEQFDRGWYAAPLGWIDSSGDGDFALGIRSAVFSGATGRLYAGAGIVADSDPAEEWDELQLKYRPVLDAFADS